MPKYRSINLAIPKLLHSFENITMISASFLKCDFQKASLQSHYAIILHGYQEFEEFLAVKYSKKTDCISLIITTISFLEDFLLFLS